MSFALCRTVTKPRKAPVVLTQPRLAQVVRSVEVREIKGMSLCGVMMMAVMLDRKGSPVRPTISWLDQRVLPQLHRLKEGNFEQAIFEATGTALSPSQTLLPLLWVKENEPKVFSAIDRVTLSKDYVRFRLTGHIHTDLTDASGTLLLDNRTGVWNTKMADLLGLPERILPDLVRSAEVTGYLSDEAATDIGLPAGLKLPVVAGAGDGVSAALGLDIVRPGQLGVTVGTAGVLMSASSAFVADDRRRCLVFQHPAPGLWYLVTATNTSGEAARWFSNAMYGDLQTARYSRFIADANRSPPGSRGLVFLPYLAGSRSPYYDAWARGVFLGLDLQSGLPDMARSVMEGVAYELRDCFEVHRSVLATHSGGIADIRISGGIVRNPLWLQILADILHSPLRVPEAEELGVLGAAMNAAVGVGYYDSHEEAAQQMLAIRGKIEPIPQNSHLIPPAGLPAHPSTLHSKGDQRRRAIRPFWDIAKINLTIHVPVGGDDWSRVTFHLVLPTRAHLVRA
jgi:xylulokinase